MKINIQLFGEKARVVISDDKIELQEYNYSWKKYVTLRKYKVIEKSHEYNEGGLDMFTWGCYNALFGNITVRLWLNVSEWVKNGKFYDAEIHFVKPRECHKFIIMKIS